MYSKNFEIKWIVNIFRAFLCTCTSQSKQCFLLVSFVPQLLDTKCYKNCLHVAIFNHSKKFLNIFKTGLKNWHEVIVQQSLSEKKKMFQNKNLHTWMVTKLQLYCPKFETDSLWLSFQKVIWMLTCTCMRRTQIKESQRNKKKWYKKARKVSFVRSIIVNE